MDYNWNWSVFWDFAPGETSSYLHWLVTGTSWTLATTLVAFILALLIGGLVGTLRTSTLRPLVWLCNLYTEVFRNIPLLVQMFICFFVVPELLPVSMGDYLKQDLPYPSFFSAVVALTLFTSAKLSELFKAGIESVAGCRWAAGRGPGAGPAPDPDVPAGVVAPGDPRGIPAADLRGPEHPEELIGGPDHRLDGVDRAGAQRQ